MYFIVDFIWMGLRELRGTRSKRELQNEKILPTVGFELTPCTVLRFEGGSLIHTVTRSDGGGNKSVSRVEVNINGVSGTVYGYLFYDL